MLATSDSVHAKDALAPLTGVTDRQGDYNRDGSDTVHAKDALAPLTQVPAGDQGHTDPVHARAALAPLTDVPAEGCQAMAMLLKMYASCCSIFRLRSWCIALASGLPYEALCSADMFSLREASADL